MRLVAVDDVAEQADVALDERRGPAAWACDERPVDLAGQLLQPVDRLARRRRAGRGRAARRASNRYTSSRRASSTTSRMRARAAARSPRQASSQRPGPLAGRERRGDRAVADARRRAAAPTAAGPHSPSSRWPWATPTWAHTSAASWPADGAASATAREPPDRLAGPAGVAGDLGERHLEPHPRAHRVRGPGPLGGRLEQLPRLGVAAAVGQRVGLVDEVLGDAATGEPARQVGVLGAPPGGRAAIASSKRPSAERGSSPWPRPARPGSRRSHGSRSSRRCAAPRPAARRRRAGSPAGRRPRRSRRDR